MSRMAWTLPALLAVLGVAVGAALVAAGQTEPARAAAVQRVLTVEVMHVDAGPVPVTVEQTGVARAAAEVELASRVTGPVVWTAHDLRPGRRVVSGETLARIDPTPFEASVAEARSSVASAKEGVALEAGRGEVASLEQQLIGGEVSELARRGPQRQSAQASLNAAQANLAKAEQDLANTRIRAPFDGLLVEESLERGSYVSTGASVGRLVGSDTLWVELPMSLGRAQQLQIPGLNNPVGSLARVGVAGTQGEREGYVLGMAGELDPTTRSVTVLVAIDAPLDPEQGPVVLPGSFVQVHVEGRSIPDAVRLPTTALVDNSSVWTVSPEGAAHRVGVEVVWREGEHVVVRGLTDGDVVIDSSGTLLEGALVRVEVAS